MKMKTLIAAVAMVAAFAVSSYADNDSSFRIMSFNILHGASSDGAQINIAATAAAIAAESPDFVCLQEVDKNNGRSGNVDQAAYLAEAAGLGHSTFCKTIDFANGGQFGIAILSKTAPLSVTETQLPSLDATKEQRMLLICEFENFYVANAHFELDQQKRLDSVDVISNAFANLSKPVFFTGDWNAAPSSVTLGKIKGFMTVVSPESGAASYGSSIIDYIAIDTASMGEYVARSSYVRQEPDVSDHNPVVAEIVRRPAAAAESSVWYNGDGVVAFGVGEASVAYRSDTDTTAWLDITVADGAEATLTALTPPSSVTLSIQKLGGGSLVLTNACGGFADLHIASGAAVLASATDVPGTTYLDGGELVAATNFTAGAIVLTADSSIRVAPGMELKTGKNGSFAALNVAGYKLSKFGEGKLNFANPVNASGETGSTYIVEEGELQLCGDCWGGHNANASGYTLVVHENGTVTATTHVPLPNVTMRGGRLMGYHSVIVNGEQTLNTYKSWAFKHMIKVQASTNGSPSVVNTYACHIGHDNYMPTFDIDAGAELQLDALICNGEIGGGKSKASGFTKVGAGTLAFLRGGSLTGTTTLKEGTLKFAAGASLGPDATLNTYAGTTIELEDGAAFETPVNSSLACTAAEYAALTNCAIWVDAWQETAAEGASVPTIANLGTVAGSFAPPTTGSYKTPCTFTTNGVNGRPSYKFNGSNQSMLFSDLAYGTLAAPKQTLMLFIAFERKSFVTNPGMFSFSLASNTAQDNNSKCTLRHEDPSVTWFGIFNNKADTGRFDLSVRPSSATDGVPSILSLYGNGTSQRAQMDTIGGTVNSYPYSYSGAFSLAFDRMSLGSRMGPNGKAVWPWNGAIGEVIVCTNYNSITCDTILSYLKRKWHSGRKGEKCGVVAINVPQGTAAAASVGGLNDGRTPTFTKTGAGELMVGSVAADGDVVVSEGALSLIPTSVVAKVDVWMDAADESTLTVANGEVVSVRNKGRAGGSFVKNPRTGTFNGVTTVSPNLPLVSSLNGHTALGFDGTRALVLDSYTNHNDDATYTVFVAARIGDGVEPGVSGNGQDTSPYSVSSVDSVNFDYQVPVGSHFELKNNYVSCYCDVPVRAFNCSAKSSLKAGDGLIFAHYNHNYGAYAYLQTFTNGVAANASTASNSGSKRPYPAALDVISVGGRFGPKGTSYYYGSASSGRLWRGEVGELIVCTRQPTADERAAILAYLRAKWFTSGGDATTPAAIAQPIVPALGRNVKMTVSGGAELKSLAATQPLASLSVTGDATLTRGGMATPAFDISGGLLLPSSMTLRMLFEPSGNEIVNIVTWSGTFDVSGTTWSIDARRPSRWAVEPKPNAIQVRYTKPGAWLLVR